MSNCGMIVFLICHCIIALAFIALPVVVSYLTGNWHYMWLIAIACFIAPLSYTTKETDKESK